ncbi:hypothetical protein [Paenibacillus harenae]|uniref:hypothetical protein n=1 Tax=Paenibacillus harenae TaxID=306543 RepID=UPI00040C0B02|nr:hypothetical protein [Paenibacillus harenae]
MSRLKKIICLTLLLCICVFPASALASSGKTSSDNKNNLFSNIFSFFSVSGSQNNYNNHSSQPDKYNNDKNWNNKGWIDWFDKDDWWDKDRWWDDICWWDDDKYDSFKLWERYYCY